jgi:SAM-dependent methyltransferase
MATSASGIHTSYTLDNSWQHAHERLALLEAWLDPGTIHQLQAIGVAPGWRCLEVGAGAGSIAAWLSQRVGTTGHVLATDIDTRFLDRLEYPNLEVRRHDITTEALPEATFDLVHGRMVLMHLGERDRALECMVRALKPGGWLLLEEGDVASWLPDPRSKGAALFCKATTAFNQVQTAAGVDLNYGRRLYGSVAAAGLGSVEGEGCVTAIHAGSTSGRMWQLTFTQCRERIVGAGLLTDEDMDEFLALFDDASFAAMDYIVMAVWGRKP